MGNYYETFNPPFFLDLSFRPDFIKANRDSYERRAEEILKDIKIGLNYLKPLTAPHLVIHVDNQTVTLSGSVSTQAMARFIERMTSNTLGVRSVKNEISIQRAGASAKSQIDQPEDYLQITRSDDVTAEVIR